MPLSRHTVGNEFALGGRDLYRAADQHDPEAVLDGVAMAGLVGVLRQLGDLAEYVRRTIPIPSPCLACSPLSAMNMDFAILVLIEWFQHFRSSCIRASSFSWTSCSCISNCCVMVPGLITFVWIFGRSRSPNPFFMLCYEQNGRFSDPFSFLRNGR